MAVFVVEKWAEEIWSKEDESSAIEAPQVW